MMYKFGIQMLQRAADFFLADTQSESIIFPQMQPK